ncbi:MAG: class I SAM-dependent methyltransferase [Bacteroidota bacterium]
MNVTERDQYRTIFHLTWGEILFMKKVVEKHYEEKSREYRGALNKALLVFFEHESPLTILDVGCADGALGAALKSRGHKVFGIEISRPLAQSARKRLDAVVVGNVEELEIPKIWKRKFDAVIFGDVLEHLFHPQRVLDRLQEQLAPGGFFVICVPNIGYLRARLRFLFDTFSYEPKGIFDDGHIRMFNERILTEMVHSVEMRVVEWRSTYQPVASHLPLVRHFSDHWLYKMSARLERPLRNRFRRMLFPEFVIKAVKV